MTDSRLRSFSLVVAALGLVDAAYLTWIKFADQEILCAGAGGCSVVNSSAYSEIAGIPIALFGALAYVAILALLYLESRGGFWAANGPLGIFGLSLAGVLYSAYLTYIEVYVLQAICPFCVFSAVALLVLLILAILRLLAGMGPQAGLERR